MAEAQRRKVGCVMMHGGQPIFFACRPLVVGSEGMFYWIDGHKLVHNEWPTRISRPFASMVRIWLLGI